jgi:hypothetical protein
MNLQESIWYKQPTILLSKNKYHIFFPTMEMSFNEKLNACMRFSIYLCLLLSVFHDSFQPIIFILIVAIITFLSKQFMNINSKFENMDSMEKRKRKPTQNNPFMNTLVSDLNRKPSYQPLLYHETNDPDTKKLTELYFYHNLYKKTDDIYNRQNNQNRFFTMPTSEFGIAHGDTVKFANWCYNNQAPTCKENSRYCTKLLDRVHIE